MELRFIKRYDEMQKEKHNEAMYLLGFLIMIAIFLIITFAPVIDSYIDYFLNL